MYQQLSQIISTTRRVPFTQKEIGSVIDTIKYRHSKGTDLSLGHPRFAGDPTIFRESASEGTLFLHSPEQLATGFLFIKLDAGRSLFGRQKAVFASFIGSELFEDQWFTGTTFKSWMIALTSIGNIYRDQGYR